MSSPSSPASSGDEPPSTSATPTSEEPEVLTKEERNTLSTLVIGAARAEGFRGQRFAARWLHERYGVQSIEA